ncbi:uncharacterized protein [Watersipora subatra]|uniref:uncharacterized protein n=1 Tax=Watersipora subatra TaxID=2589382 RepID=UPI00355C88C9
MGCGSSVRTAPVESTRRPSKAKREVLENYRRKSQSSIVDRPSVTHEIVKNSKPGASNLLNTNSVATTGSQIDFFRMLDDKMDQGLALSKQKERRESTKLNQ